MLFYSTTCSISLLDPVVKIQNHRQPIWHRTTLQLCILLPISLTRILGPTPIYYYIYSGSISIYKMWKGGHSKYCIVSATLSLQKPLGGRLILYQILQRSLYAYLYIYKYYWLFPKATLKISGKSNKIHIVYDNFDF